ncbi:MAG: hypothetical protein ACP5NW_03915 [Candidatus Woesearchaeota archaeon]
MKQDDINKDLGSYLSERKGKPFWKRYGKNHTIKPKYDEAHMDSAIKHEIEHVKAEEEHTLKPEDKKELESMEEHVEEINEEEKEFVEHTDEEREGVLKKFFKKLNFSKEEEEDHMHTHAEMSDNPEIQMTDEELRELLHGLHNWIIQLPADKLEKFKNSKEFELYTKYLRKHNLIK